MATNFPEYTTKQIGGVISLLVLMAVVLVGAFAVVEEQREIAENQALTVNYNLLNTSFAENADNWENTTRGNNVFNMYEQIPSENVWYGFNGWAYRQEIIIDKDMVENENFDNFVLLLDITHDGLKDNAQDNGLDIFFTPWDCSCILPHEIENYDNATGHLVAWIRTENLSHTEDTTLYMFYSSEEVENMENVEATWADNYWSVVYHLNDTPTGVAGDINDSADNEEGTSANMLADDLIEAKISGGLDFDGVNDKVSNSEFGDNFVDSGMTLMFWTALDTPPATQAYMRMDGSHTGYSINQTTSRTLNFAGKSTGAEPSLNSPVFAEGVWTHYTMTYIPGERFRRYINGGQVASSTANINNLLTAPEKPGDYYISPEGDLDEYRIYARVLSQNEIVTIYRNQNDNSYISLGALENGAMLVPIFTEIEYGPPLSDNFENGWFWQTMDITETGIEINSAVLSFSTRIDFNTNVASVIRTVYIEHDGENNEIWTDNSIQITDGVDSYSFDVSDIVDDTGTYTVFLRVSLQADNTVSEECEIHVGWDDVDLAVVLWDEAYSGEVLDDVERGLSMISRIVLLLAIGVVAIFFIAVVAKIIKGLMRDRS